MTKENDPCMHEEGMAWTGVCRGCDKTSNEVFRDLRRRIMSLESQLDREHAGHMEQMQYAQDAAHVIIEAGIQIDDNWHCDCECCKRTHEDMTEAGYD